MMADALGVDDSRWTLTCAIEGGIGGMVRFGITREV